MAGMYFIFVILPISLGLLLLGLITKQKIFGIAFIGIWVVLLLMLILSAVLKPFNTKIVLKKSDYYGSYIIDRDYFKGEQADWQYNNFRFEIKENDALYFYATNGKIINKVYKGTISTITTYPSEILAIKMEDKHHILKTNPTIYRDIWDFHLVFNSPKFNNMFFKKGEWKEIE